MEENRARNGDNIDRYYTNEKIGHATRYLAMVVGIISGGQASDNEKLEEIRPKIDAALSDMLKILAVTGNGKWDADDRELITNSGNAMAGYDAICYKYGEVERFPEIGTHELYYKNRRYLEKLLKERTILKTEVALRADFCEEMIKLLGKERSVGRPQMNALLDQYSFPDRCYLRMNCLLNQINMTNSPWPEFCVRMKANVEYLQNNLADGAGDDYVSRVLNGEKERMRLRSEGEYVEEPDGSQAPFYELEALNNGTAE